MAMDIDLRVGRSIPVPGQNPPRRLASEFPACACDCLSQVDKSLRYAAHQKGAAWNIRDLQNALDQDLFCLAQDRRKTRLTHIQELKLLDMLCSYFQEKADTQESRYRYAYFELVFCGREGETLLHEARIGLLVKLCSLAVQCRCDSLFVDIATWLLKVGLAKPYAKQIVAKLVKDFCSSAPGQQQELLVPLHSYIEPLITTAPEFAFFFLNLSVNEFDSYERVPLPLLEIVSSWLCLNSRAVVRSLAAKDKNPNLNSLNRIFYSRVFPKMVRLTCVAPLTDYESAGAELLAKLHTGLLQAMLALGDLGGGVHLVTAELMVELIEKIDQEKESPAAQLALDRVAQLMQVSLATKCFHGHKEAVASRYRISEIRHELLDFALAS